MHLTATKPSDVVHRGYFAAVERITRRFALPTVTTLKEHEILQFIALCEHSHVALSILVKNCDL